MSAIRMWMVRGDGGRLYEEFRQRSVFGSGWHELMDATPGMTREKLVEIYGRARPDLKRGTVISGASQVWRFINEIQCGDYVVTYSPSLRRYLVGRVSGDFFVDASLRELGMPLLRGAEWLGEVNRDVLTTSSRNALGSTLTIFVVSESAAAELLDALGRSEPDEVAGEIEAEQDAVDLRSDVESRALEFIKDKVSALDWDDMQELVAGILRAMGYKTRVSAAGPDRGKDIVASPDGLGFETPRIVVEVKHRSGPMGAREIRSFLGGRRADDRGLYVSTGGFSREAHYEAERSSIPLTLMDLDELVRSLVDIYEQLDIEAKALIPLKRIYWPAT